MHADILIRLPEDKFVIDADGNRESGKLKIVTTAGRCIFNDVLDERMGFYNYPLGQKGCSGVISDSYQLLGRSGTLEVLDAIKSLGFKYSTLAGLSFGITDLQIPKQKESILAKAQQKVDQIEKDFKSDAITGGERNNQIVDVWIHAREEVTKSLMKALETDVRPEDPSYLNPVFLMSDSGARGSVDQIRQLAGMRGLMSKPSGEIIETPIKANFREGLTVLEYLPERSDSKDYFRCSCFCGNEKVILGRSLRRGLTRSCGCLAAELQVKVSTAKGIEQRNETVAKTIGRKFYRWTVLAYDEKRLDNKYDYYFCRCDCGQRKTVDGYSLRNGLSRSCGCGRRSGTKELTLNKQFGQWAVVSYDRVRSKGDIDFYTCRCVCGTERSVQGRNLRHGYSRSCGCQAKLAGKRNHAKRLELQDRNVMLNAAQLSSNEFEDLIL